jgi:hypothetical protein
MGVNPSVNRAARDDPLACLPGDGRAEFGPDLDPIFPRTTVSNDLFAPVPAPADPVIERYGEVPWPAEGF